MRKTHKLDFLVLFLLCLFLIPFSFNEVYAQSQEQTFEKSPLDFWNVTYSSGTKYNLDSTVLFSQPEPQYIEETYLAISGNIVIGSIYAGSYIKTHVSDDDDWSITAIIDDEDYLSDYYVQFSVVTSNIQSISVTTEGAISTTLGNALAVFSIYNHDTSSYEDFGGSFTGSSDRTKTFDTSDLKYFNDNYIRIRFSGTATKGYRLNWDFCKINTIESKIITTNNIIIDLTNQNEYSIKFMIESESFSNDESIEFYFDTELGKEESLILLFDKEFNNQTKYRFEFQIKKAINVYRIYQYDENNKLLEKTEFSHIISKRIESFNFDLINLTDSSSFTLYYLIGAFEYVYDLNFEYTETLDDSLYTHNPFSIRAFSSILDLNNEIEVMYKKEFSHFQFIRTYANWKLKESGTTGILAIYDTGTFLTFEIGNYTINFDFEIRYDDSPTLSYLQVFPRIYFNDILEIELNSLGVINTVDLIDIEQDIILKFCIWRTQENNLGIAFTSNSKLLNYETSTPSLDVMNIYLTKNQINSFKGSFAIEHIYKTSTSSSVDYSLGFSQCEYSFSSDFGIVQPHFSSTWFDLLLKGLTNPLGLMFDVANMLGTNSPLSSIMQFDTTPFFDFLTGIADSIGAVLSPMIESISAILSPIIESVYTAVTQIVTSVADNIITWVSDCTTYLVEIFIPSVLATFSDFIYWFVNSLGLLFGIVGLTDILIDLITNFVIAITTFLSGVIAIFSIAIDFVLFTFEIITKYLPTVIYYGTFFIVLSFAFTIITMDEKKIMALLSMYWKIISTVLDIGFKLGNAIIQFIGGIIP